jgi:hypothetical protein
VTIPVKRISWAWAVPIRCNGDRGDSRILLQYRSARALFGLGNPTPTAALRFIDQTEKSSKDEDIIPEGEVVDHFRIAGAFAVGGA